MSTADMVAFVDLSVPEEKKEDEQKVRDATQADIDMLLG